MNHLRKPPTVLTLPLKLGVLSFVQNVDKELRNGCKQVRAAYTQEFRLEAVRLVQSGQSQMQVCQALGITKASLGSWVRQVKAGTLKLGLPQPYAIRETLARGTAQKGRVSRELRTPQNRGNISCWLVMLLLVVS